MLGMLSLVSQDSFVLAGLPPPLHEPADAGLLDAYSRAVISTLAQLHKRASA